MPNTTNLDPLNMMSFDVYDPWVIPDPLEVESYGATKPLSLTKLSYVVIQLVGASNDPDSSIPWNVEPN